MSKVKNAFHDDIIANTLEADGHEVLVCPCGMRVCAEEIPCDVPDCILHTVNEECRP